MAVPVMAWIGKRIQQVETVAGALVTTDNTLGWSERDKDTNRLRVREQR